MPLFVVETISQFRIRYVIECESAEHAEDTIVCEEADEYSQKFLGETILGTREISMKKFHKMNDALNNNNGRVFSRYAESGSPWMGEKMIHKVDYQK